MQDAGSAGARRASLVRRLHELGLCESLLPRAAGDNLSYLKIV